MSKITENRQGLQVLVAGAVLQLFLGIIYVWSVFKAKVSEFYGWDPNDVGSVAPIMLCFFVVGILAGGRVSAVIGLKFTALIGGLLVSAGMLAAALIPAGVREVGADGAVTVTARAHVFLIYLFYGIAGGFGVGAGYNAALTSAQKWFPKNKGFASGVSVGAFGFSTVIFAPVVKALLGKFEVNAVFLILSGVFAAAVLSIFGFIKAPEQAAGAAAPSLKGRQYTTLEMLGSPRYYLITLSMMLGLGLFFIINPDLIDLANDRGAASFATGLVMLTGIANALGRICVPMASDRIGREYAAVGILAFTAISALALCSAQGFLLIAVIAVAAFCFGGYAGLYPVITSENFGLKNIAANYGAVMVGFMLSSLLSPVIKKMIGGQTTQFAVLAVSALVGIGLVVILKVINSKARTAE